MRSFSMPPNEDLIYADTTTAILLPQGGPAMPLPLNRVVRVIDNLGTAVGTPITVTGAINGAATDVLNTAYADVAYRWNGLAWNK